MFNKNTLKSGEFVSLVPLGIHLTIQYNSSGNIEKIFTGYYSEREDVTAKLLSTVIANKTFPVKIHLTNCTSWVRGVLYTNELVKTPGILPNCVQDSLIKMYLKTPSQFNFFAGTIDNTSTTYNGATAIRQCLAMAKFRLLPGWIVPNKIDNSLFTSWIDSPTYQFNPIVTDYLVFSNDGAQYISTRLHQYEVSNYTKYVDENGYVKANLFRTDNATPISIDYSDLVKYNIHKGTHIIANNLNEIVYSKCSKDNMKMHSKQLKCSYCGNTFDVPEVGSVKCTDIHCSSHMLSLVKQFIGVMRLPDVKAAEIHSWLRYKTVTCIPDVLLLDKFKGITINTSYTQLLRALIPTTYIASDEVFSLLSMACVVNKSFMYYVENPNLISKDLGIVHKDLSKLISWLSDNYNASDIITILDSEQIVIDYSDKRFEGAPIFRGKTIYITGDFIRGSLSEISSILQSYSATVTTQFSDFVNCVLVGGMQNNVNGRAINSARTMRIPVMDENTFFNTYDIDSDLR